MNDLDRLNAAVDQFTKAMKRRLRKKYEAGYTGWNALDMRANLTTRLRAEASRTGNPKALVNIANFAMMLWNMRGKR